MLFKCLYERGNNEYLNVENVSHDFGGRTILENASFRLLNGELYWISWLLMEKGNLTFLNIHHW